MYSGHVAVFVMFLYFEHLATVSSYTGRCHSIREAIQHHTLQICFLAYTNLFSIKSNVLKLDTAQKVYSVNKGLFLGVFSLPCFTYMSRCRDAMYHALINYLRYSMI